MIGWLIAEDGEGCAEDPANSIKPLAGKPVVPDRARLDHATDQQCTSAPVRTQAKIARSRLDQLSRTQLDGTSRPLRVLRTNRMPDRSPVVRLGQLSLLTSVLPGKSFPFGHSDRPADTRPGVINEACGLAKGVLTSADGRCADPWGGRRTSAGENGRGLARRSRMGVNRSSRTYRRVGYDVYRIMIKPDCRGNRYCDRLRAGSVSVG